MLTPIFLQDRDLLKIFKIPPEKLVSFLLTLEDHYLKVGWQSLQASDVDPDP